MKECKDCDKPLNLESGDTVRFKENGDTYFVGRIMIDGEVRLRLFRLKDGSRWSDSSLFGSASSSDFEKVEVCYRVEEQ